MNEIGRKAAETVVNAFAGAVDKMFIEGKVYQRLVAVDDDVFSAFIAAERYHYLRSKGIFPKVDCIGGFGLMSGKINPKQDGKKLSEAVMLLKVLVCLGVPRNDIDIICSKGTNTGANLSHYARCLEERDRDFDKLLFCLTKRLAGRFYLTQICQQPQMNADYYWLEPENECQLYNGKSFAGCLPYLSEAASIYDRYLRYAYPKQGDPVYMSPLKDALNQEAIDAGEYLCQNYLLKIPGWSLRKVWQYLRTYCYFLAHRRQCRKNLSENICHWQELLMDKYAVRRNRHILKRKQLGKDMFEGVYTILVYR